jgi:hypothetical protein
VSRRTNNSRARQQTKRRRQNEKREAMPQSAEIPPILSLHRYYCSATRMQDLYEAAIVSPERSEKQRTLAPDMFAIWLHSGPAGVLYYWYGTLFVVKEGYDELGLHDAQVDSLLADSAKVQALKRCRHGTFHFQRKYFDERFLELMREDGFVQWVRDLTTAFGVFLKKELAQGYWNKPANPS